MLKNAEPPRQANGFRGRCARGIEGRWGSVRRGGLPCPLRSSSSDFFEPDRSRKARLVHAAGSLYAGNCLGSDLGVLCNRNDAEFVPLSIGLIGYGHFGTFLHGLAQRYLPDAELKILSGRQDPDGILFFPLEEVAACDAVVLAVPISAYADTLAEIGPLMRPDGIVVDIATVKKYTTELLEAARPARPFIAMHPMFGPESYAKLGGDVAGLRIVVTGHTLEPSSYSALCRKLAAVGFSIIEMTAEAHDKDLAETLFLTHYIGQVIARGGFERTDIDTVSFGFLMDAVDSVRHDGRLFEEVCRFNPYCRTVIERFDRSDREVRDAMLSLRPPSRDKL